MKEYGGYIELETNRGSEYHKDMMRLNCGRNCLAHLLRARQVKKIFLPDFLCDSVKEVCKKYGVDYEFYSIDEMFRPRFENRLDQGEFLYVVNYYGQITKENIQILKEKFSDIIVDNVHAFFESPIEGVDTLYSCRKFFGVSDGAYLSTSLKTPWEYPQDISYKRMGFLLGRLEKGASEFYPEYVKNDKLFDCEPIKEMSKLTQNILKGIDYPFVKKRREDNFSYLSKRLGSRNELVLQLPKGPYAYPFLIKDGSKIRKKMQERKIYIPTLWPNVLQTNAQNTWEYRLADDVLPLPVDQRYSEEDMAYICDILEEMIEL